MGKNKEKTNVMRILDQKKIAYESYSYVDTGAVSGIEVAEVLGENPDMVFKNSCDGRKIKNELCLCHSG